MDYLPVCFNLRGRSVLLVGGGVVATRKAKLLLRAGAILYVLAQEICSSLRELVEQSNQPVSDSPSPDEHHSVMAVLIEHVWDGRDLSQYAAVVVATPDHAVNANIAKQAHEKNIPVNVVDNPDLCSFIFPAIIDRNPLLLSVSSSGASPVLARRIRSELESQYPKGLSKVAKFFAKYRKQVLESITDETQRRIFWESLLDNTVLQAKIFNGDEVLAKQIFDETLHVYSTNSLGSYSHSAQRGAVYLIGAGPGDPELMTFKALRLLQRADVVLYDRLIGPDILEFARRDAEKIYVGKQRANHTIPQSEINAALLNMAKEGKHVARLKGGDPFIFGRGGEEVEGLMNAGVHFEVVPGITAASGAACYGGIPLTHRDYAQSVRFITGHTKNHQLDLPWKSFLNTNETLVFYMGLAGLSIIIRELITAGRDPDTPMAVVEKATLPEQRVITGSLLTMEAVVEREKPSAPTLLIIGDVVKLQSTLDWFS